MTEAAADKVTDTAIGRVSVIIPTFNRAALLAEALASLEGLRWKDVEVIVVDDGSTDDTETVISSIRSDGFRWPIDYIWQTNAGPGAARNAGRRRASGEYIYHLDSDDLVAPNAFEDLIPAMQRAAANFAVGIVENTDYHGKRLSDQPFSTHVIVEGDILQSSWYTHAAVYRRDILDCIDGYNESLRTGEDTELHWRIIASAGWPAVHEGLIAARRVHNFGHLGKDSPARPEQINTTLRVYEHFFHAFPKEFCTVRNAFRVLYFGIESGLQADAATKRRCQAILARMAGPSATLRLNGLTPILKPDAVIYYRVAARLWRDMAAIRRKRKHAKTKAAQQKTSDFKPISGHQGQKDAV